MKWTGLELIRTLLPLLTFWVLWSLCIIESFKNQQMEAIVIIFMYTCGLACRGGGQRSAGSALRLRRVPLPDGLVACHLMLPCLFPQQSLVEPCTIYVQS